MPISLPTFTFLKVGFARFYVGTDICKKLLGQKKWAFARFWPIKVGRKNYEIS